MPDVLYRLTYDTTIPEAVDVALRLASRTDAFRRRFKNSLIYAGIGAGLVFFVAWLYVVGNSALNLVLAAVAGTLFGIVVTAIFRRFLENEIRSRQRKSVTEQFGDQKVIRCELELRPDAVWVRQSGVEMLFPWTSCTRVQNNPNDIEMRFTPGICVVRNRHFASPAERQTFLETAQRLSRSTATPGPS